MPISNRGPIILVLATIAMIIQTTIGVAFAWLCVILGELTIPDRTIGQKIKCALASFLCLAVFIGAAMMVIWYFSITGAYVY